LINYKFSSFFRLTKEESISAVAEEPKTPLEVTEMESYRQSKAA